ncbi:proteasome subunit RPN5 (RPN5) [Vairimorpha necatrix]|uniref:Proteasome subunit RPN5 (RPN5) n=1 Tax=Vairimorpha necatrix TaxID=6039 RepID=A0AAX4JFV5_9MICR
MNKVLIEQERLARKDGNIPSLKSIFIEMLKECSNDKEIISLIKVLSVRRGQSSEAIRWLVNEVYDQKKDSKEFVKLLLNEVVEGKIYLERERVKFSLDLMNRSASCEEALGIILDVPIETFTLVDDSTIIKYQLDQFRLCIENRDWVKASIVMKRIRQRYFEENNAPEERLNFYKYKIQLLLGQSKFEEASQAYLDINKLYENTEYSILASFYGIIGYSYDKKLLEICHNDKNNDENMRLILDKFLNNLLITKEIIEDIRNVVKMFIDLDQYIDYVHEAINNHNYMIIEKYYSTINLSTFTNLMDCKEEDLIKKISNMVNNKRSYCKINQRERLVVFDNKKLEVGVDELMDNLIKVDHLIHKETFNK